MSSVATHWCFALDPKSLSDIEFRVLTHLCDCHTPAKGCFPSQAYLLKATGKSNGGLNNALRGLEEKGLIKREKRWDPQNRQRQTTFYFLGFELLPLAPPTPADPPEPSPSGGDGLGSNPSPRGGDGAISTKRPNPSPPNGQTHLHTGGDITINNQERTGGGNGSAPNSLDAACRFWAAKIQDPEAFVPPSALTQRMVEEMLRNSMVTPVELAHHGIEA